LEKTVFGYSIKKFIFNWFIVLLILVIGAASVLGYNTLKGTLDLPTGFNDLSDMFGGFASVLAIFGVIILVIVVAAGLAHLANTDYIGNTSKRNAHVVIGVVAIVLALIIGKFWIELPDDGTTIWILIGAIVVVTVATALVTQHTKKVVVASAPTTTPAATPADPETSTTVPPGTAASS
jgi:hypothetical protein